MDAARGVPQIDQDSSEIKCPPLTWLGVSAIVPRAASTAMRTTLLQALERAQIKVDSDHSVDFVDVKVMNNG